jgi:hypothetical protein
VHVVVTNDGSSRAAGLRLFVNGKAVPVEVVRDHLTQDITGGGGDTISLGERFRDRGFKGGLVDDLRVFARDLSQPLNPGAESAACRVAGGPRGGHGVLRSAEGNHGDARAARAEEGLPSRAASMTSVPRR